MKEWLWHLGTWAYAAATNKYVLLSVGGAAGTNLRYLLGTWIGTRGGFPLGTFVINVTGSFVLGLAFAVIWARLPPAYQHWLLLIGTGFCGGYTTFSTFAYETYVLVNNRNWWFAGLNAVGSVLAGLGAVVLAVTLVNLLFPKP